MRLSPMRLLLLVPVVAFVAMAGLFAWRITDGADRSVVPSALIGRPAPDPVFAPLEASLPGVDPASFKGRVSLVNVFASWCAPCRVEHPELMALSATPGLTLVGLNYKDRVSSARAFLAELGNPYDAVGVDPDGRAAIEWGVYGVPESFLVGPDGTIRAKHVGPLSPEVIAGDFGETMRDLLAAAGAPAS
ncbi:DsbE family thiol:disulfide interchange protein [Acuticoccus mangrovi]|nr:DsbE family thiol:disulfide interchange protein [Acuticoccus mangrovi]